AVDAPPGQGFVIGGYFQSIGGSLVKVVKAQQGPVQVQTIDGERLVDLIDDPSVEHPGSDASMFQSFGVVHLIGIGELWNQVRISKGRYRGGGKLPYGVDLTQTGPVHPSAVAQLHLIL